MIYFTSDTHFGSQRTLELSKRPFDTVVDMDSEMIDRWNNKVSNDDTVYHLGDFGDYSCAKCLNGKIKLIFGNYERVDIGSDKITITELCSIFDDIYTDKAEVLDMNLVHEPSKYNRNKFNLFGHIHGLQKVKKFGLNVGVDCHNFEPISLDEVNFYRNAIDNFYDNEVFMTGDNNE